MKSKTLSLLNRLYKKLSVERKKSLFKLLPIAVITGLSDVLVVGLVSRLFGAVVGKINRPTLPFSEIFPADPFIKVIWLIVIYISVNWLASILRLFLRAYQERLRASIFLDLSQIAQRNIFNQKYEFFLSEKSEDISSKVLLNISRVSEKLIRPILQIVSGVFIVSFIFLAVLSFAKITALYLIISLVIGYTSISLFVTPIIRDSTKQRIILEHEISKVLSESIKTITDVYLTNSEKFFENKYNIASQKAFPFLWKAETMPEFPRSLIEPFGITLIFFIGLIPVLSNKNPTTLLEIVPFLATIAVASLKLTPPLQDLFRGITDLRAGIPDLEEALKIIDLPNQREYNQIVNVDNSFVGPTKTIELSSVFYRYPLTKEYSLKNINLKIPVGSKIAFIGTTGSGKTTTANQVLCLLRPTRGSLLLDGEKLKTKDINSWQTMCSYVPQSINLLNEDILTNIAYGLNKEEINESKVWDSVIAAQLEGMIKSLPAGLKTKIGENGVRLSGGQRQRIAIARAFYRDAKLLVLDEATSALDNKTESDLMEALDLLNKKLTTIFVAHRLSTVKNCDCIYEFQNGEINAFGNFDELYKKSETFNAMIKNEYF
tara:strand:- start:11 stop:1819 length:1809 start_codon:yes stop_codon:yes gene_type:complete